MDILPPLPHNYLHFGTPNSRSNSEKRDSGDVRDILRVYLVRMHIKILGNENVERIQSQISGMARKSKKNNYKEGGINGV